MVGEEEENEELIFGCVPCQSSMSPHDNTRKRRLLAKKNKPQQLEIDFIDGINRNSKIFLKQEAKDIELLITEVWDMYDQEDLGCLGPANVKLMLEDLSGLNNVSETQVKEFLLSIDEDKNGTINRTELSNFIHEGLCLSTAERIEYSKRGELQNTMVQFFDGVDTAKNAFIEKGRDGLDAYLLSKKTREVVVDDDTKQDVETPALKDASANDEDKNEENVLSENTNDVRVDSSLILDSNYDMVPEHETTERQKYEKQIIAEFSSLLNIENDRFKIRSIKAGSVIIDFSILPSGKGDDMPAQEAMELLSKHISNPQSNLFSSSNFPILKAVNAAKSLSGGNYRHNLYQLVLQLPRLHPQ